MDPKPDIQGDSESGEPLQTSPELQAQPTEKAPILLQFEAGDSEDPRNFKLWRKIWVTIILSMLSFLGLFGTSVAAPAEPVIAAYVHASIEVTTLLAALYILGFALGPMIWAPLSELYGRRWAILPATFVLGLFSIGTATSKNLASILVTRFFAGVFASAATSISPAALGDIFEPRARTTAMGLWIEFVIGGPSLAPIIGAAATANKHLGWRWTEYIEAIIVFFVLALAVVTMPETYAPVLLEQRAKRIEKERNLKGTNEIQIKGKTSVKAVFGTHLTRPMRMVLSEPILVCISFYTSFIYGIPFMVFQFFPIVFFEERGWRPVASTLPFLAILIGSFFGTAINFAAQPWYVKAVKKNNGQAVPEARLPPIVIGAGLLSIGLFWFGWTASPKISWISPVFAGGFIGAGFTIGFQQCVNFVVDLYGPYAASAISVNTTLRSVFACGLTVASRPMFLNMGVGRACSLLGGISCIAFPIPFLLIRYGAALRRMSKFVPAPKN